MSGELQAKSWSPAHVTVPLRMVGQGVGTDGLSLSVQPSLGYSANGKVKGMVRPQGRHWFVVTVPQPLTGNNDASSLQLDFGQHSRLGHVSVRGNVISDGTNEIYIPSGPFKLLVLIDFTDTTNLATVRVLGLSNGSETTLATLNLPVESTDLGLMMGLSLHSLRNDALTASIDATKPALAPVQIPIGYEPLVMVGATIDSSIATPAMLQADRDGVYDDYVFRKGSQFMWLTTGLHALQPVSVYPTSKDNAVVDGKREFTKPVIVQGMEIRADLRNLAVRRPTTVAAPGPSFTLLNTGNLPVFANGHVIGPIMDNALKIRNTVAMGEGFGGALNVSESALMTMASGAAATVDRSSIFGTNLLPQVVAIKRATVLGNDIGKVATQLEDTVAAGNDLLAAMTEIFNSVVIGARAHNAQQRIERAVTIGHGAAHTAIADGAVVLGYRAGYTGTALNAVALGSDAGTTLFDYSVALGAEAQAPGKRAVQLGRFDNRVVGHHGYNTRADERDVGRRQMATSLGLAFIRELKVEEIGWNYRDAYIDALPVPPRPLSAEPTVPTIQPNESGYQDALVAYQEASRLWLIDRDRYSAESLKYATAIERCMRQRMLREKQPDASKTDQRLELTVLADSIELAARKVGAPQSIVTDYSAGGQQVKTRDDGQMIAALVLSVQQLDAYVHSDEFAERVAAQQLKLMHGL